MATKLHESLKVQSLRGVKPSQEVVASLSMDPEAHGHEPKTENEPHHGSLSMDPGAQESEPKTTSQSHVELSLEPGVEGEGRKTETLLNHLDEHYHREEHHINEKVGCLLNNPFNLFDLILYVPSTIFQLNRDGSSWVEPVLS